MSMYGSHTSWSAHTLGWRSPLRVSVVSRAVGVQHHGCAAVLLDVPQRRLPHLIVRDRDTDKHVGIEHLSTSAGRIGFMKLACRSTRRFWSR
jgi:Signal transduction protein containing GAF and PtsI domains